jgi:metal-dependent HD superfamily phosphatase/phosphodiesterase
MAEANARISESPEIEVASKSPKESALDRRILRNLSGRALHAARLLIDDPEVKLLQDYANAVSITRLGYNDHGPVHMRKVAIHAIEMVDLLCESGVHLNLETEELGTIDDSRVAVLVAAFLHDVGMSVCRDLHEHTGVWVAMQLIDRILHEVYADDLRAKVIVRSMVVEGIVGHMGTHHIHSLEAGLIPVADGCDMEKGRARIPMMISTGAKMGDIHRYSATAIERVDIVRGSTKPICIHVHMTASAGFFQVEEVLLRKISFSPVQPYVELTAELRGDTKRYL